MRRAAPAAALLALALLAAPAAGLRGAPAGDRPAEGVGTMNAISLQFAEYRGDATELARRVDALLAAAAPGVSLAFVRGLEDPPLDVVRRHFRR